MFNRFWLNAKEMQKGANWSTHETDWKNSTKLNLTKARNTGSSSWAALFPFLKGLKAEIIFLYTFGKEKGYLSNTLHTLQGKILPIAVPCWGRGSGWLHVPLGLLSLQYRSSSENELRKERIIWSDGKYYLPLLKHRVAYCFFEISSIIFWLLVWYRQAMQGWDVGLVIQISHSSKGSYSLQWPIK